MKDWTERLMDKLSGEMSEKEAAQFETYTKQDQELNDDYTFFQQAWNKMDAFSVEPPSQNLSENFYAQLDQKIDKEEKAIPNKIKQIFHLAMQHNTLWRNLSFGLFLLAFGFILGGKWNNKTIHVNQTTVQAVVPNENSQTAAYIPSSQRIQSINQIPVLVDNDEDAIANLVEVIKTEQNTNVKLAAIRQLDQNYSSNKSLRSFIARQIEKEKSPMVQLELVNFLIDHNQPKETINTMESILNKRKLNPLIEEKIKKDLPVLRASYVK